MKDFLLVLMLAALLGLMLDMNLAYKWVKLTVDHSGKSLELWSEQLMGRTREWC